MVLNYHPTNYIGWPIPALYVFLKYIAKVRKKSELCKYFSNYFVENQ